VTFLGIDSNLPSVILSRRPFARVLCDFSFQTTALSTPANPGHNDLDEQETGDEGQNQEQIKIFFRHCPWLSMKEIEQCLGRYEREGKLRGLRTGFLKSPDMAGVGMSGFYGRE
jgi:hypothetical protein